MKREGRQHGIVRSHAILPAPFPQRRHVKTVDVASLAGVFTKVSTKPTNQSKFTGKCAKSRCNACHVHPACKSKDKAKGTMKMRSVESDFEFIRSTSAKGAFEYLANDASYDDGDECEGTVDECGYGNVEFGCELVSIVANKSVSEEDDDDVEHTRFWDSRLGLREFEMALLRGVFGDEL